MISSLKEPEAITGDFVGIGVWRKFFIRGKVDERELGEEVKTSKFSEQDLFLLRIHLSGFCKYFGLNLEEIFFKSFLKLYPYTHRSYGKFYAY